MALMEKLENGYAGEGREMVTVCLEKSGVPHGSVLGPVLFLKPRFRTYYRGSLVLIN